MAFRDYPEQQQGIELLQRSLVRGRLGHGYLFTGHDLSELEGLALSLAKTLNCQQPLERDGVAVDCCDQCVFCRKIAHGNAPDLHWARPESKSRVITTDQMRELMKEIQLRPTEAGYKVAIIVAADRLRVEAANAFLKTLEEPPPKSLFILLTTEPQRILETMLSRCLRLNFAGDGPRPLARAQIAWLAGFGDIAAKEQKSLLSRYRLLDVLLRRLVELKSSIEENLTARSPLQRYQEAEKATLDRWEDELTAAVEAEYRHQRAELLAIVQRWLRDIWLLALARLSSPDSDSAGTLGNGQSGAGELLSFPQLESTRELARRVSPSQAIQNLETMEQIQRWLGTNVQEALALEVGLLKLHLGAL